MQKNTEGYEKETTPSEVVNSPVPTHLRTPTRSLTCTAFSRRFWNLLLRSKTKEIKGSWKFIYKRRKLKPGGKEKSVHALLLHSSDAFSLSQILDEFHHSNLLHCRYWKMSCSVLSLWLMGNKELEVPQKHWVHLKFWLVILPTYTASLNSQENVYVIHMILNENEQSNNLATCCPERTKIMMTSKNFACFLQEFTLNAFFLRINRIRETHQASHLHCM